jgi:hypothetical protein
MSTVLDLGTHFFGLYFYEFQMKDLLWLQSVSVFVSSYTMAVIAVDRFIQTMERIRNSAGNPT